MLTIMVPTMNRSEFLIRQLEYYAATGYPHWVAVADSSDDHHRRRTEEAIARLKGKLKVVYHHMPKTNDYVCLKYLVDTAQTPYAVYCGDDDFMVTSGVLEAVSFLERNSGYAGANGRGVVFTLENSGPYGRFAGLGEYAQKGVEQMTAKERLMAYASSGFVSIFSVLRVALWQKMYHDVHRVPDKAMGAEILPCYLSVIYGRIKHLDHLYLIRQVHDQRYTLPDVYDWLTGPLWGASFQLSRTFWVDALMAADGMDRSSAEKIVKQAFMLYLKNGLRKTYQNHYCTAGWQVLGRKVLGKLRTMAGHQERLNLKVLLDPASLHFKDFVPLHACVTRSTGSQKITEGKF